MRPFPALVRKTLAPSLALSLVLAACSSSPSTAGTAATTVASSPRSATSTSAAGGAGSTSSTTASPAGSATSTTNPSAPTAGGAIVVTAPGAGQTVVSPVQVTGRSRVAGITLQLSDATGTVLANAVVHPAQGAFSVTLRFATTQPGAGTLTAFDTGPGGARQDITQVPVQLSD